MKPSTALALLIGAQALHSLEEYVQELWLFLPPARVVADALAIDPATGFAISNGLLVGFGVLSWTLFARGIRGGRALAWGWGLLECANSVAHGLLALSVRGYFPGLWTAPLLLAGGICVLTSLRAGPRTLPG